MPVKIVRPTASAYVYPLLIKHLLHGAMSTSADQEITYQGKRRHTYRTFHERLGRLANGLTQLGVEAGQTVAVMDWDSHRYLECYFAVPMMGAILQTVNVRLSVEQIIYTINHAKADVLMVNREFFPLLQAMGGRLETVRHFILIDDEPQKPLDSPVNFAAEYEKMLETSDISYDFPDFDENAQATTFFTTGTTGAPKGVYFSHRQLVLHTLGIAAGMGGSLVQKHLHRESVYMPMTPMFHVHAWGFPYLATMMGLKQVYPGRYLPGTLLQLISDEKVSFSHCVPSILQMLFDHPGSESFDLSRWTLIIGGSVMPETLADAAAKRGINALTGYGMSETCPVLSITSLSSQDSQACPEHQARIRCKTGLMLPLVDLRIVDPQMRDVAHDGRAVGEVVARAPWLTQGYVDDPVASEDLWADGYLHTQDIGNIDPRGYLKITDRIKDVIKTAGEWISSLELENVIVKHEAVQEVAVIGVADEKWGERPLALAVLKPEFEGKISAHALRNFTRRQVEETGISRHSILLQIKFVKALSKTSVGKLNKREERAKYERERG